jgi:phosphoglycolate phosphatase-like HAD superfamily hydrolase
MRQPSQASDGSTTRLNSALPPADAYVFDIDGTLLNSRDLVHWNAFHRAIAEAYGSTATLEGVQCHGMTDVLILRAALARAGVRDGEFQARLPRALEVLRREVDHNRRGLKPEVCIGIKPLLRRLHDSGHLLGVASGNLASVGWHKIRAAGLRDFFSFGSFSDECESRTQIFRNAIAMAEAQSGSATRVCFVGDTPFDIQAARDVGAPVVAVATGIFSIDELKAGAPDVCVAHCEDLLQS